MVYFSQQSERFIPVGFLSIGLLQEMAEKLMLWLQDSLLMESQQPSVRYQQEWLLVRLVYHHLDLRDRLWDTFQQVSTYTKDH
jgi:hypothetical protein